MNPTTTTTPTPNLERVRGSDLFLQLGAFGALYACISSILILLYRVIDAAFPPILSSSYSFIFSQDTISFQVAILIVFFPIYLVLSSVIQKLLATDPVRRESRVRRGLIYLTLFIAGVAMAWDLVDVIYSFLNGDDVTAGFLLKALSVLLVFGDVFYYYVQDVRQKLTAQSRNALRIISVLLIVVSIIWGFAVMGSPRTQKHQKLDQQKVSDLMNIQSQVISYYQSKGALPNSINDLQNSLSYTTVPKDAQTGQSYEYNQTGQYTFDVCATFNTSPAKNSPVSPQYNLYGSSDTNNNWQYQAGHYCFHRTLDPQLYPVYYNGSVSSIPPKPVIVPRPAM